MCLTHVTLLCAKLTSVLYAQVDEQRIIDDTFFSISVKKKQTKMEIQLSTCFICRYIADERALCAS